MTIKVSENFRAVFYAPFYAALALDLFRQQGLEVEFMSSPSPGAAIAGLIDGSLHVAWGGPMRVMKAQDQDGGPPLVCFCEVVRKDPFFLLGNRRPFELGDLRQMRLAAVAEVPTPWLCLQHDLRELNIDPSRIERSRDRTMPENLEALARGEIDVAQLFEPFASMAERLGVGEVMHAASARGLTSYTTLLVTRPTLSRHRGELSAMRRAIGNMQSWLADHGPADLAALVAPYFAGVAKVDLLSALRRYQRAGLWSSATAISKDGFQRLAISLCSGGFISRMPDFDDCVADALLDA